MRHTVLIVTLAISFAIATAVLPFTHGIASADEANLCYKPVFDPKTIKTDTGARPGSSQPTTPITYTLMREDGSSTTEIYYRNPASWGPSSGTVVYESALAASNAGASGTVILRPKVDWNSMFWLVAAPADFTTVTLVSGVNSLELSNNNGFPVSTASHGAEGVPFVFLTPDPRGGYHGLMTTGAVLQLLPHVGTLPNTFHFEVQIPACAPDPQSPDPILRSGLPFGSAAAAK